MAHFHDLSPYTYTPSCGMASVNIGWLDEGQEFPTGATPQEFDDALWDLCKYPLDMHRGCHECWFCRQMGRGVEGNGQIRVQGASGVTYVAPALVHHYVTCHRYRPPEEFIDAVLAATRWSHAFDDRFARK